MYLILMLMHRKFQSMRVVQNYHYGHTRFEFSMTIVVILYDIHTLEFAVWCYYTVLVHMHVIRFMLMVLSVLVHVYNTHQTHFHWMEIERSLHHFGQMLTQGV